jgi:hypothetical protein
MIRSLAGEWKRGWKREGKKSGSIKASRSLKKGIPMGLSIADLITLTEVSEETAISWYALLKENPDAELPKS